MSVCFLKADQHGQLSLVTLEFSRLMVMVLDQPDGQLVATYAPGEFSADIGMLQVNPEWLPPSPRRCVGGREKLCSPILLDCIEQHDSAAMEQAQAAAGLADVMQ